MADYRYLQVTRICNLKCTFCSNPYIADTGTFEEIRALIDMYMKDGAEGIIFTGGEPTLVSVYLDALSYCRDRGIPTKTITNGHRFARLEYAQKAKEAGCTHLHVSFHSVRPVVSEFLTKIPAAVELYFKALENCERVGIRVDINCVINKYNANHLSENVRVLCERFPFITHFSWNNLDPTGRVLEEGFEDTVPKFSDFEVELAKAARYLEETGRTFRVERVPLCYMQGFEYASTETRKMIAGEARSQHFIERGKSRRVMQQLDFEHDKSARCRACSLNKICGGIWLMNKYYFEEEVAPVSVNPQPIIDRVLAEGGD